MIKNIFQSIEAEYFKLPCSDYYDYREKGVVIFVRLSKNINIVAVSVMCQSSSCHDNIKYGGNYPTTADNVS